MTETFAREARSDHAMSTRLDDLLHVLPYERESVRIAETTAAVRAQDIAEATAAADAARARLARVEAEIATLKGNDDDDQ